MHGEGRRQLPCSGKGTDGMEFGEPSPAAFVPVPARAPLLSQVPWTGCLCQWPDKPSSPASAPDAESGLPGL